MKAEAEANADADKAEKEKIEKINQADTLVFQTEKQIKPSATDQLNYYVSRLL